MTRRDDKPSIMDAPSAKRAALFAGAVVAAIGAALFITKRRKGGGE